MLITQDMTPEQLDYKSGRSTGNIDAMNEDTPMVFTKSHSLTYRKGYREGWACAKAMLELECCLMFGKNITEDEYNPVYNAELKAVTEKTNEIAECSDDECSQISEWIRVIQLLEAQR